MPPPPWASTHGRSSRSYGAIPGKKIEKLEAQQREHFDELQQHVSREL
jgi:hypothetical protein